MYEGLLLSTGGGIITDIKKSAYQIKPAIIIGLGSTGIDALKAVRKKVYENILPDDPAAAEPEYKHIKFLAVDTDCESFKGLAEEECMDIRVSNMAASMERAIWTERKEFNWLEEDLGLLGGGRVFPARQVGRYCLFKNIDKITDIIRELKTDVTAGAGDSEINVHIITGITGATGGGTFIDMCYIIRDLLGAKATLFGYFFMPDVNLNKPGIDKNAAGHIKSNGYAALKELDYTMNLGCQGKRFKQYYGGPQKYLLKETAEPLVNLCYLISGTDKKGVLITNGYDYSMEAVGEFILRHHLNSYALRYYLFKIPAIIRGKEHGAYCGYYTLGISTAELPTKEIGTYLAAKLYQRIGSGLTENVPTYNDLDTHAEKMGLTLSNILGRLCGGVTGAGNIDWTGTYDFGIEDACSTTISVTDINIPDVILEPIRHWKNENSGNLKKNFEVLTKDLDDFKFIDKGKKATSLISSVFRYLQNEVVSDFRYGAVYASKLTYNNHDKSLNDYLDGQIETLERAVSQWQGDLDLRVQDIEAAVVRCKKARVKKIRKLYAQHEAITKYKDAVRAYYRKGLDIEIGEYAIKMIAVLKQQINGERYKNSLYPMYFKPMENMLIKLKNTFEFNLDFLLNHVFNDDDVAVWKMVNFKDIQNYVDSKFDEVIADDSVAYNNFINEIMKQYEKWCADNSGNRENNVVNMINSYIGGLFEPLLNESMESYLSNKFGIHGDPEQLQATIKKEIFNNGVLAKAEPKFYISQRYNDMVVVKKGYLSVPYTEANICEAAKELTTTDVRITAFDNIIFAVKLERGIPLYAYGLIDELERQYNAGGHGAVGRHLYEITDRNRDINWANLQSLIPYSINPDACADGKELEQLYYDAVSRGVISENQYNPDDAYNVYELNKPIIKDRNDFMNADGSLDINKLNTYIAKLESYTDDNGKFDAAHDFDGSNNANIKTIKKLLNDGVATGDVDYRETCRIDYFIRFRGLQEVVKESMKILDDVDRALEEANNWIKEANNN